MDIGLILQAAYFEGTVYEPSVLGIDEDLIYRQITLAAFEAFNLSVNATIMTRETAVPIIGKAFREARGLAIEASIYEKDVIDEIIGKAQRESAALQHLVGST
jgi:large subunit ribosomal protein L10